MVNVPIKLYSATESKTIHFHEVHAKDGVAVEHRRICPKDEREVPYEEIVKGYEVAPDEYVVLDKDEIKAAAGDRGKVVHLEEFVDAAEIDPIFFEKTYYVGSRDDKDAYRLLYEALRQDAGGPGSGGSPSTTASTWSPCAPSTRSWRCTRCASTTRSSPRDLKLEGGGRKPTKQEIEMADQLVESLGEEFDPERYEDTYREAVLDLIKRKAAGKEIDLAAQEEPEQATIWRRALEAERSRAGERADGARRSGAARSASGSSTCRYSWSAPRATSTTTSISCTRRTRHRIEQRRFCSEEDVEVGVGGGRPLLRPRRQAGRGHRRGARLGASPRKTRTIEIEAFVDLADVDPIYFDHPYFLVPAGESEGRCAPTACSSRPWSRTERVALGRFVHADQGVPGRGPRPRRRARAHHDALPRRGPAAPGSVPTGGKKPTARRRSTTPSR